MVQPWIISSPEKQNGRENHLKGPANWRITVWQECMSNTTNQLEGHTLALTQTTHLSWKSVGRAQSRPILRTFDAITNTQ